MMPNHDDPAPSGPEDEDDGKLRIIKHNTEYQKRQLKKTVSLKVPRHFVLVYFFHRNISR